MIIQFKKTTDLDREIWFQIVVDGWTRLSTQDETKAKDKYFEYVNAAKNGLPLEEIIEEITIPETKENK